MAYTRNKSNNFDLFRLVLAVIVFFAHSGDLSQITALVELSKYFDSGLAVDGFFVISGFLIFMSYENSGSLKEYYSKRMRRVYPAYVTVVLLCAFLLFFTSNLSAKNYFSIGWFKYIIANLTFMNFIQSSIPGVFENNPVHAIDGALWTIKVEVMFYISVPIIGFIASRIRRGVLFLAIYILAVGYSSLMLYCNKKYNINLFIVLERQLPGQMAFFIAGASLYYYYSFFERYLYWLLVIAVIGFTSAKLFNFYFLHPASVAVLVIYLCTKLKYLGNWGRYGDFSYGTYIWHFPIIQIFIFSGLIDKYNLLIIPVMFLVVIVFAVASWKYIEKPFLKRGSHYIKASN